MHIKSFYTQQHCYVSLKALYPGGIRTWVFSFLKRMRCPLHHAARAIILFFNELLSYSIRNPPVRRLVALTTGRAPTPIRTSSTPLRRRSPSRPREQSGTGISVYICYDLYFRGFSPRKIIKHPILYCILPRCRLQNMIKLTIDDLDDHSRDCFMLSQMM
jgi:hypothetical protein